MTLASGPRNMTELKELTWPQNSPDLNQASMRCSGQTSLIHKGPKLKLKGVKADTAAHLQRFSSIDWRPCLNLQQNGDLHNTVKYIARPNVGAQYMARSNGVVKYTVRPKMERGTWRGPRGNKDNSKARRFSSNYVGRVTSSTKHGGRAATMMGQGGMM